MDDMEKGYWMVYKNALEIGSLSAQDCQKCWIYRFCSNYGKLGWCLGPWLFSPLQNSEHGDGTNLSIVATLDKYGVDG